MAAAAVLLAALSALPALAQSDGLAMLGTLARGEWTVKPRDGSPEFKLCVKNGTEFIQIRHKSGRCNRFVVEDAAARVAVQYTCPGDGYGRTALRRETASLIQIESQGIASSQPFQFAGEARRTGAC